MISRPITRTIKAIVCALACVAAGDLFLRRYGSLPKSSYVTGWPLFFLIVFLALYNGRKKIPFLPTGRSRGWMQIHIYVGLFTGFLFLLHVQFRVPTGHFEIALATLYMLVMGSGFFGLYFSRVAPGRLTARGGEVIFESIPVVRRELRLRAEALAMQSIPEAQASTVADFYARGLAPFFSSPKNFWAHLFERRDPLNRILKRMSDLERFLNDKERQVMVELAQLVRQKDGLDYHHALQLTLKVWLFAHIPLTYSLLIFSLVHLTLVYAIAGGD